MILCKIINKNRKQWFVDIIISGCEAGWEFFLALSFSFSLFSLRWVGEWIIRASTKWSGVSGAALIPGLVSHMCNSFIHQCCVSSRTAVTDWTVVFTVVVKWLWLFDVCKFYFLTLVSCLLPSFLPGFLASQSDKPTCYLMWSLRPTAWLVQQHHSGFVILFANMDLPEAHLPAHSPLKHSLLFQTPACLPTTLLKVQYSVLTGKISKLHTEELHSTTSSPLNRASLDTTIAVSHHLRNHLSFSRPNPVVN